MNQEVIKKQAKEIMDNFVNSLGKISVDSQFSVVRQDSYRKESEAEGLDEDFKHRFLSNAAKIKGDAVLSEKGSWVK